MTEQELNALMGLLIDKHYFTYQDLDKIYDLKGTKARRVHRFINIVSQGLNNNVALSNVNAITLSEIGGLDLDIVKELRNYGVILTISTYPPLTSIDSVWKYAQKNGARYVRSFIEDYFYLKAMNGLKRWSLENAQHFIGRRSYMGLGSLPIYAWVELEGNILKPKISYDEAEKAMYELARVTFQNAMEMPEEKKKLLLDVLKKIYFDLRICYQYDFRLDDDIPEDDYYEQLARDAHLLDLNKMNAADFKEKGYKTKGSNFEGYLKENSSKKPRKIDREVIRKAKRQLVENEFDEEFTYEPAEITTEVTRVSLQELKDLKLLKRGLITPEYFARMHNMPTSIIEKLSNLQSIKELAREYAICKMDVAFKLAQTSSIGNSEDETIDIKSSPLDSQKDKKLGYHNVPRRVRLLEHNKKLHHKKTEVEKIQFEF